MTCHRTKAAAFRRELELLAGLSPIKVLVPLHPNKQTRRRLHWQVGGLLTLEDAVNVTGRASVWLDRIWTIRDQAAVDDEEAQPIDCGSRC